VTRVNREVKHGVYGKRQTAKMKLAPSLFSCVYSRVKLFVFTMNSNGCYSIFVCIIYGLEEKNSKSEVISAVSRLPLMSCLTSLMPSWLVENEKKNLSKNHTIIITWPKSLINSH